VTTRYYTSVAPQTTLTSTINSSATSITLASTTGLPGSFPFTLALDFGTVSEELVEVTALGGLSANINRAIDGTSATTHNAGAVVRHVSSARDFADSRNHENSATGIHGLTVGSALVGTIDTQTLTNKTLASPVITGPVGGDLTFTGNETFSGNTLFTNPSTYTGATVPTTVLRSEISGDANGRFFIQAGGGLGWSDGTLAGDTNLYRASANVLSTDDKFRSLQGLDIQTAAADSIQFKSSTAATSSIAFRLRDSASASVLTIDDRGHILAGGLVEQTPDAWINNSANLVWTTATGLNTPSLGNATVNYWYKVISGTLFVSLGIDFGSTTNFGAAPTTNDNWQFSLPAGLTASVPWRANRMQTGNGRANGSETSPFIVRMDASGGNFIFDTSGGNQSGTALTHSGLIDSLTPFLWTAGAAISFNAAVPIV
jgi:hypothetical protein